MKFIRRQDLDAQKRIEIAASALLNQGIYGHITYLSKVYKASRTFVYQLLWAASLTLTQEFSPPASPKKESLVVNEQLIDKTILLLGLDHRFGQ